jgi:hypothetical protein
MVSYVTLASYSTLETYVKALSLSDIVCSCCLADMCLTCLEEDVAKPSQEDNGPHKVEAVVCEGLAHPDTAAQSTQQNC